MWYNATEASTEYPERSLLSENTLAISGKTATQYSMNTMIMS
jgi:hypothetical protein